MQSQELTPKQQAVELIKQANHVLLVTGRTPNNDQLGAMTALDLILKRAGKQVSSIITGELPKAQQVLDTSSISRDLTGIRDFIVRLDTSNVEVDKLRYEVNDNNLEVIVSPYSGNFTAQDASFDYGAYKFDLVVVLGVSQIAKIDTILEQNPTIFDGLHLINIDSHRSNEQYGSINFVDPQASSVCEMLVGVIESVAQGMIDYHVATSLLTGIMSATQGFTGANTTAKSLTISAQMMSGGAKQQEIVQALFSNNRSDNSAPVNNANQNGVFRPERKSQDHSKPIQENKPKKEKTETIAEKLAKQGVELKKTNGEQIVAQEVLEDETLNDAAEAVTPTPASSSELPASNTGDKQSIKKFNNPKTAESLQETSKDASQMEKSSRSNSDSAKKN